MLGSGDKIRYPKILSLMSLPQIKEMKIGSDDVADNFGDLARFTYHILGVSVPSFDKNKRSLNERIRLSSRKGTDVK